MPFAIWRIDHMRVQSQATVLTLLFASCLQTQLMPQAFAGFDSVSRWYHRVADPVHDKISFRSIRQQKTHSSTWDDQLTSHATVHDRIKTGLGKFHTDWCEVRSCTPEMFGDSYFDSLILNADTDVGIAASNVPFPGGNDRLTIARNNSPNVQNRVYLTYEHLEGVGQSSLVTTNLGPIDRYVVGIEKTLGDRYSIEVRVPFANQNSVQQGFYSIQNDSYFGDISAIFKAMIFRSDRFTLTTGVGVQLPTGDDVVGTSSTSFVIENEAIYVSPFLATLWTPNEDWFLQSFVQFDFTAQGDAISRPNGNPQLPAQLSATINNQNLARASVGGGRWFFRNDRRFFRGMAGLVEVHYTHTLTDADNVVLQANSGVLTSRNSGDDQHQVNLTAGLHTELAEKLDLRVGASVPLLDNDRFNDVSVMVQLNYKFGRR